MSGLSLLAPIGLLSLVGIPLVILFHMRHTTPVARPVPTLRFWRQAMEQQHEHERFRRPPISLLLLLQLALVALIGLALARPVASRAFAGLGTRTEPQHLIVLLDGSTSMSATDTASGQTRFQEAQAEALDLLGELREGDVATVILLGTHPVTLEATDNASIRALRERLRATPQPGGRVDLNAALRLTSNLLLPNLRDRIVLISDGALSADPEIVSRLGAPVQLDTLGGISTANVAITELSTRGSSVNPGQQTLYAGIKNFSDSDSVVGWTVTADDFPVDSGELTLAPGELSGVTVALPKDAATAKVTLSSTDALLADNHASVVLVQGESAGVAILYVSDAPSALQKALTVLPGAAVTVISTADAADPNRTLGFDLVVYEGSAPVGPLPRTPILFVNQPENGLLPTRGLSGDTSGHNIRAQDPLLAGVELTGVFFGDSLVVHDPSATTTVVAAATVGPLIYRGFVPGTDEHMVALTFDVNQTNLPKRVAFPILVANIVNELAPSPLPSSVALGDPLQYRPRSGAATVRFTPPSGDAIEAAVGDGTADSGSEAAGSSRYRDIAFADTGVPGEYRIAELDNEDAVLGLGRFYVNAGHIRESELRPNPDLAPTLAGAVATADGGDGGASRSDFWPLLVLAGLLVLLLEWTYAIAPWRRARARRSVTVPAMRG